MVPKQLAERGFVHFVKHVAEFLVVSAILGKARAVVPSQRTDKSVAVLLAYLAIFVAVPVVDCHLAPPFSAQLRELQWVPRVLPDNEDAVADCEALGRVGRNRHIKRGMPDGDTGRGGEEGCVPQATDGRGRCSFL
jgi:hypothetical protein